MRFMCKLPYSNLYRDGNWNPVTKKSLRVSRNVCVPFGGIDFIVSKSITYINSISSYKRKFNFL